MLTLLSIGLAGVVGMTACAPSAVEAQAELEAPKPLAMSAGAAVIERSVRAVEIAYVDTGMPTPTGPRGIEAVNRDEPSVIPRKTSATTGACDKEAMAQYIHMHSRPESHWKCMEWAQQSAKPHELWDATWVLVESGLTDARVGLPAYSVGLDRTERALRNYVERRGMTSVDPFDYAFASSHLAMLMDYAPPDLAMEGYRWQLDYLRAVEARERVVVDGGDRSELEIRIHQAQVVLVERLWAEIQAAPKNIAQRRASVAMEALYRGTSCHLLEHMPVVADGSVPDMVLARHTTICESGPGRLD